MRRLFSGVAFAALTAVAAPVWAQAPTIPPASNAPSGNPPAAQAPATAPAASKNASAEKAKPAPKQESKAAARGMQRPMRHAGYARHMAHRGYAYGMHPMSMHRHYGWSHPYYRGWGVYGPTDFMARQLNGQELSQISSGGGTPYPPRPYPRSGY